MGNPTDIFKSLRGIPSFLSPTPVGSSYGVEAQVRPASANGAVQTVNGSTGHNYLVEDLVESIVSPPETIPYQASGGDSERREYEGGEGLLIEAQGNGYVIAWSAEVLASDFLDIVGRLVDARPVLEDVTGKRRKKSLSKARAMVADNEEIDAIQIDAHDEIFRWTSRDPYARERSDLTRVTLASLALDPGRVMGLIAVTATPNIKGDLAGIAASIGHLTHMHVTASSAAA